MLKDKYMFYGNRIDTGEQILGFLHINDHMSAAESDWSYYIKVYDCDEMQEVDVKSIKNFYYNTI